MTETRYLYRRASFKDEPSVVAGCKMPSELSISLGDLQRRLKAKEGSAALLRAIQRYIENNMPRADR